MRLLVMVPTYNESLNIEAFLQAVFEHIPHDADVLVIDDNSPDGTARLVEAAAARYPGRLYLLNRPDKGGLAQAYLAAFDWGLPRDYDVFLEIDADFSHNPAYIPGMIEAIQDHDVVIGSRNIRGGGVEGWPFFRQLISKGGSWYSRVILGCPVRDLTGGFNMWRKSALEKIGLCSIISKGYSFQIEMKYRAYVAGCSIEEIPILFSERKRGTSKMSKEIFLEALAAVWKMKKQFGGDSGINQFVKFGITGALGTLTNTALFFLCADVLSFPEIPVSAGCFCAAATQNYLLNHRWSFRQITARRRPSLRGWLTFIGSSLGGLLVTIAVMEAVIMYARPPYKFIAQLAGIAAGMAVNFTASKFIVFKKQEQPHE